MFFLFPDSGLDLLNGFDFLFWSILNGVTLKTSNKRDVKKQRFQVRYWVVSNIFIFLYISREKFVEKFSKCCENGIACLRKGKLLARLALASYADALWARHAIFLPHERLLKRMGCLIRPITADFPFKAANFDP